MDLASKLENILESIDALHPTVRNAFLASLPEDNEALISFPAAKWDDFFEEHGTEFGLQSRSFKYSNFLMENDITPTYQLPRSFHKEVCKIALVWMGAYRFQRSKRTKEEAHLRMLEPFLIPIISLFQGRILDKSMKRLIETKYSTGGRAEHAMFLLGGALFLVVELKLQLGDEGELGDYVTQLFLELLAAAQRNGRHDFKNLKVYGLLSDFSQYYFYTYHPETKKFFKNQEMRISDGTFDGVCEGMMHACNKIFGLVLTAYIGGLRTIVGWDERGDHGNRARPWKTALRLAEACRTKFEEPVTDLAEMEQRGIEALENLTKSASSMPVDLFHCDEEPTMPADREKFADALTARVYESQLRKEREQRAKNAIRVQKRKRDSEPEVDDSYIQPEGLRRSSRSLKSAKLK
ncbi:hypothetical protein GALMADRAFT_138062 [Galerina marginata CBS 339.88]|uniref:Uncharacterized protein n=1 Tax=Galerina marginata (strain CBS 339.88) TaxID=685588 RepID=A0A067T444_GALM3|nr:hypothetical protein GALMADRAFT_138062 [Galerina marginata CBS 339.88]